MDDTNRRASTPGGIRAWFQPEGVVGPVVALLTGGVVGATMGYGVGALAGVVGSLDLVVAGSVAGAVLGAAVGLRGWWLDRRKGNGWTVDPWSPDN